MFKDSTPLGGWLRQKDCSLKPGGLQPGLGRGHTPGNSEICGFWFCFLFEREMLFEVSCYFKICKIFIQSHETGEFKDS